MSRLARVQGPAGFGSMAPPPPEAHEPTIHAIRWKLISKLEAKCGIKTMRWRLQHAFRAVDLDEDGLVSLPEWVRIVEALGCALQLKEAAQLFLYYDTADGARERSGAIEQAVVVADVLANRQGGTPEQTIFAERGALYSCPPPGSKSKANLPSEHPGGLFAGGAYETEWTTHPSWNSPGVRAPRSPMGDGAAADALRTRVHKGSNASSVEGGIFAPDTSPPAPRSHQRSSNDPSMPGGIFAAAPPSPSVPGEQRRASNCSSVPGGLFAPSTAYKALDGPNVVIGA